MQCIVWKQFTLGIVHEVQCVQGVLYVQAVQEVHCVPAVHFVQAVH